MKNLTSCIAAIATLFLLSACVTPSESEGDRLQRVGEQSIEGLDTSGLEALQ